MAKTIKFNLICDDKPIRTIEDLQNNFSIEDVLEYYDNKLLHRWLEVRGYENELERVKNISSNCDRFEVISELINIFDVLCDKNEIKESIYMLRYLDERKELNAIYAEENYKVESIIDDYFSGYRQLVDSILANPNDVSIIKASISEIVSNYNWVFRLNHRELFWILTEKSILAIMCFLMNKETRTFFLPLPISDNDNYKTDSDDDNKSENNSESYCGFPFGRAREILEQQTDKSDSSPQKDIDYNSDKKDMYEKICEITSSSHFKEELGDNLRCYSGVTDKYWKDIEAKGKEYMIISIGVNDYVRSAGNFDEQFGRSNILNNFLIIDGVQYVSSSSSRELQYMEV